jgi:drug/metabolite transporter (DMT)-like permease
LSDILCNLAISLLGAARTALDFYWVPIFGVAFAVAFLRESLIWWHAVGLLGVIVGSRLGTARSS